MSPRARFPANPVTDVREFRTPSPASELDSPGPVTPPAFTALLSSAPSSSSSSSSSSSASSSSSYGTPQHVPIAIASSSPPTHVHQPLIYTPGPSPTLSTLIFSPNGPSAHTPSPKGATLHVHPAFHGARLADALRGALPPAQLSEPATSPPVLSITIRCDSHLPWLIKAGAHPARGGAVTVGDVLEALRDGLRRRVSRGEYDAERRERRAAVRAAFEARTRTDEHEYAQGLRRVDFLEGRVLVGLRGVGTNDGAVFEILLGRP